MPAKQNETLNLEPFILECAVRGHSVAQVFKAIKDEILNMIPPPDHDEIPLRDIYNENNILRFMRAFRVRFYMGDADWFWRKVVPDHQGGWDTAYETSDSSLPVTTLLKLQEDLSQANKERDQLRLVLEEARKKLKSKPQDVQKWKDSVSAIVGGFMRNGLTQEEQQAIVTRSQAMTRADIQKMWADSQVLGDAENAFWAGL